jgi:2-hydroxy-6-oxonona-2,4-dienedioate hydrolase
MSILAPIPLQQGKKTSVYGESIHYYEMGEGPVVILLHALGWYAEVWAPIMARLAPKYRVIAIDQIGCGESSKPFLDYRVQTFSEFLQGFLEALNLERVSLIGHAFGGWVASLFASQHPEEVEKLILVSSSGVTRRYTDRFLDLNPASFAATRELLKTLFCDEKLASEELAREVFLRRLQFNDGYTVHRTFDGIFRSDQFLDPVLERITAPTLVIWGKEDKITPLPDGNRFLRGIRGATMELLEYCGHAPHIERPEDVSRAISAFLKLKFHGRSS